MHSALAALGEHGECEWLDDDEPSPEPAFPDMSAGDAMLLLFRYWRRQERREAARECRTPAVRAVPPPPPKMVMASDEEVIEALTARIETFKLELEREREEEERAAARAAERTSHGDAAR